MLLSAYVQWRFRAQLAEMKLDKLENTTKLTKQIKSKMHNKNFDNNKMIKTLYRSLLRFKYHVGSFAIPVLFLFFFKLPEIVLIYYCFKTVLSFILSLPKILFRASIDLNSHREF